jgi:opine dehydrogenase
VPRRAADDRRGKETHVEIAVIGNSVVNTGFAVAADLALAGHSVRLAAWPGAEAGLDPIRRRGGIELAGDPRQSVSGRIGLARPAIEDVVARALVGAELVFLDMLAPEFESRFAGIVQHLEPGQVVHVNIHGYWPALRLAPLLRAAGRAEVTLTDCPAPTIAASHADGVVTLQWLRRRLPVAVFPAVRRDLAIERFARAYPSIVPARNVLETGFAGLNMMIHAAMAILNIGWFDRAEAAKETVWFYRGGNTPNTGRLAEAQDAERRAVCAAYGVPFRPLSQYLRDYYDAEGETIHDQVRNCSYYQALAPYPTDVWKRWMATDVAHAHVPFTALADLAGIAAPLHRAIVDLTGAVLGRDFRREGVTLERLGLAGLDPAGVLRYVETGTA